MIDDQGTSPVIVALDCGSTAEALGLVERCAGAAGMFKVGNELFMAEGPGVVRTIIERGHRVFLDMKFHDIPNTVSQAVLVSAGLGVSMLTVHALGGPEMIRRTRELVEARYGDRRPLLVAVTLLTSMDEQALHAVGLDGPGAGRVADLARMAIAAGADGCVCSPRETALLRESLGPDATIVTPGVRMPGQSVDDQKRVATPREAVRAGSDWIVVGRYVNRAPDPYQALRTVNESLR